jgi:formimidoylglutamate deiminase
VTIDVDDATGTISHVGSDVTVATADERVGTLLPGLANLHSHAFQRAMAGRGERRSGEHDDFWSWREAMYALATSLEPDDLYRIALATYRAMVRAGYTSVAEFHYIHRDPRGAWYADRAATADALVRAARDAGIAICLLPALYMQADPFGGALGGRQLRFATAPDDVLEIATILRARYAHDRRVVVGVCAHSLRAVTLEGFSALLAGSPRDVPVHLHVAEQEREVDAIVARFGARPIELLLATFDVTRRWCLVHATHATDGEIRGMARTGAVVGLCPTTEANLGDGAFSLEPYLAAGGAFGIGSDSNVSISPVEELRWLEYGQRLVHRRRVVASRGSAPCAEVLYASAAAGGRVACGFGPGTIAPGARADFVELADDGEPAGDDRLDRYIFADLSSSPRATFVGGVRSVAVDAVGA